MKPRSFVRCAILLLVVARPAAGQNYPDQHVVLRIVNDNPAEIFIPTDFIYQYAVDPDIGGSICSPTSVSMILRSYDTPVDPLQFARDTHDPYYNMFGIWPRVVENASEYGLDGSVTRYRSWSQARDVLASGVYFYRLQSGSSVETKRMHLIR